MPYVVFQDFFSLQILRVYYIPTCGFLFVCFTLVKFSECSSWVFAYRHRVDIYTSGLAQSSCCLPFSPSSFSSAGTQTPCRSHTLYPVVLTMLLSIGFCSYWSLVWVLPTSLSSSSVQKTPFPTFHFWSPIWLLSHHNPQTFEFFAANTAVLSG